MVRPELQSIEKIVKHVLIDEKCMEVALEEAHTGALEGEVPIGAVLTRGGDIIARDHNRPKPPFMQPLNPVLCVWERLPRGGLGDWSTVLQRTRRGL
jgi:hypothetical protein